MAGLSACVERLNMMVEAQGELAAEHIVKQMIGGASGGAQRGAIRPEDALYTFTCRQKFDRIEKELARLRQSVAKSKSLHKAG